MTSHPDWVPDDIVHFYNRLEARQLVDELPVSRWQTPESYYESERFALGFATLGKLIDSPIMERAWLAINKRSSNASLRDFCWLVLELPFQVEIFDAVRMSNYLQSITRLGDEIDSALRRFKQETKLDLPDETVIRRVLRDAKETAMNHEETWINYGEYVGQRYAPNAKRIFLIRLFAEAFVKLYGTPLYSTIASIIAVFLDEEPLDPDHVRKLVKSRNRRVATETTSSDPEKSNP